MTSDPALPRLASLTSVDLALSVLIPVGWDVQGDADMLRVSGPELAGRRPTFTIRSGRPEQPGEEWFTAFREQSVARMPDVIPGFVLLDRQDFVLSSFVDVTAVAYRRSLGGGDEVSQLQAYLWASSYRMYVVDAATGRRSEDADLPLFDVMLRSIRLLPERR